MVWLNEDERDVYQDCEMVGSTLTKEKSKLNKKEVNSTITSKSDAEECAWMPFLFRNLGPEVATAMKSKKRITEHEEAR